MNAASCNIDLSNGWESIADQFIANRSSRIGVTTVAQWTKTLKPDAAILDMGCGFGIPHSQLLIEAGFDVYGIDASPSLINEFKKRFPTTPIKCETIESSDFFKRKFDGIIAIGLMFILSAQIQLKVLQKVAESLNPGGRFLFSSPYQVCTWHDSLTGRQSQSLGKDAYVNALAQQHVVLVDEYTDEGENHYFHFIKT